MNATTVSTVAKSLVDGGSVFQTPLNLFLLQALLIVVLSKIIGLLFQYINEPPVCAEMIAGILLGPSALGLIPGFTATVFPADSVKSLSLVASYGLVLFMFVVGLQQDIGLWRASARRALITAAIGVVVPIPFVLPFAFVTDSVEFHNSPIGLYVMFIGILCGVSALPVLARIISAYRFLQSPLGVFTMSATAFDDLLAWPILALLTALVGSSSTSLSMLWIILLCIGEGLFIALVVRPVLQRVVRRFGMRKRFSEGVGAFVLATLLAVTFLSESIGVTALVGAYLIGCAVPREGPTVDVLIERSEYVCTVGFVPLYFAVSGIRTKLGLLDSANLWGLTIFLIVTAILGKVTGCLLSARFVGRLPWLDSIIFGVLMNTKGLVALVTANIGLSSGLISETMFSMSIVMVIFNTLITCPIVSAIYRFVKKSSFINDNTTAQLGAKFNVVVAVGSESTAAVQLVSVAALLYGESQTRSSLQVWRRVMANASAAPSSNTFSRLPFVSFDESLAAAAAVGRQAGVKLSIKSHVIESKLPDDLCRIARESNGNSIVLSVSSVDMLSSSSIQSLVANAPCDVVAVLEPTTPPVVVESPPAEANSDSNNNNASNAGRILVAYCGSAHDDLALELAINIASRDHPVSIIKQIGAAKNADNRGDVDDIDNDNDNDNNRSAADTTFFRAENIFLHRAMSRSNIDVLWRSTLDDVVSRVIGELESSVPPALLLLGFDSPLLATIASRQLRTPIAIVNSPLAPLTVVERGDMFNAAQFHSTSTIDSTLDSSLPTSSVASPVTMNQQQQQQGLQKPESLTKLFIPPLEEEEDEVNVANSAATTNRKKHKRRVRRLRNKE